MQRTYATPMVRDVADGAAKSVTHKFTIVVLDRVTSLHEAFHREFAARLASSARVVTLKSHRGCPRTGRPRRRTRRSHRPFGIVRSDPASPPARRQPLHDAGREVRSSLDGHCRKSFLECPKGLDRTRSNARPRPSGEAVVVGAWPTPDLFRFALGNDGVVHVVPALNSAMLALAGYDGASATHCIAHLSRDERRTLLRILARCELTQDWGAASRGLAKCRVTALDLPPIELIVDHAPSVEELEAVAREAREVLVTVGASLTAAPARPAEVQARDALIVATGPGGTRTHTGVAPPSTCLSEVTPTRFFNALESHLHLPVWARLDKSLWTQPVGVPDRFWATCPDVIANGG